MINVNKPVFEIHVPDKLVIKYPFSSLIKMKRIQICHIELCGKIFYSCRNFRDRSSWHM